MKKPVYLCYAFTFLGLSSCNDPVMFEGGPCSYVQIAYEAIGTGWDDDDSLVFRFKTLDDKVFGVDSKSLGSFNLKAKELKEGQDYLIRGEEIVNGTCTPFVLHEISKK